MSSFTGKTGTNPAAKANGKKRTFSQANEPSPASGSDSDDSYESSSTDETEDEDGEELTPALDAAILRTLQKIKRKEGVYGSENVLQDELRKTALQAERLQLTRKAARKDKAFTLQDHQRLALLNDDPTLDPSDPNAFVPPETTIPLTHVQEERQLRAEVTRAFHAAADEEEEDGFLVRKEAGVPDVDKGKEAYRRFLLESGGGEEAVREILGIGEGKGAEEGESKVEDGAVMVEQGDEAKKSKKKKKERKKDKDDEFLMNYILNRGWVDEENAASSSRNPLDEVYEASDAEAEEAKAGPSHPWGELDEEDDFDEQAEAFETAYNFRFEEPGAAEIPSFPRLIPQVVRRTDDTRRTKRLAKAERKAAEKAARDEETRALKGKKRREIEGRLAILRKELGEKAVKELQAELEEGEWDEERFEGVMRRFVEGDVDGDDDEKPTWDDDDEAMGEYEPLEEAGEGDFGVGPDEEEEGGQEGIILDAQEDGPINMDADFIALDDGASKRKKKKGKKAKREARDAAAHEIVKELEVDEDLDPEAQKEKVKAALKEYKTLDHEDMIGDLPTRFKYAKSAPADFGLTPAEILMATDEELNSLVGLKHLAPYRGSRNYGSAGRGMHDRVRQLKQKLQQRQWGEEPDQSESAQAHAGDKSWRKKARTNSAAAGAGGSSGGAPGGKKRKGKKERMKALQG